MIGEELTLILKTQAAMLGAALRSMWLGTKVTSSQQPTGPQSYHLVQTGLCKQAWKLIHFQPNHKMTAALANTVTVAQEEALSQRTQINQAQIPGPQT